MAESSFSEQVRAIVEGAAGEAVGDTRFLPLVTLESDARLGLDASATWIVVQPDDRPPVRCQPGSEHLLYEVLETKRDDFDAKLMDAAKRAGLSPDETLLAFPSMAVVRAILEMEHPYLTRLALQWIIPSELRELRPTIVKIATARDLPKPVKDLAARLVVPER